VAGETPPPEDQQGTDERTDAADTPAEPGLEEGTTPGAPEAAGEQPAESDVADTPAEAEGGAGGPAEPAADAPAADAAADAPAADAADAPAADAPPADAAEATAAAEDEEEDEEPPAPREKPAIPGMDLEVDIVVEGEDPLGRGAYGDEEDLAEAAEEQLAAADEPDDTTADQPIAAAAIDLGADARYTATGKRKTAIARVILRPGNGSYSINGKSLDEYFPRATLQRNIRQPLEAVGYDSRMDVVARMHGGGVSAQAGALRHGISRALIDADPGLRGELKRRGFLTRDARAKERKKAGLKKARKRPQFSKR
jgi:small subunit ribosomal protein S9